ncbi:MAG: hypothetical protein K6G37_03305 [Bacilli bacterium]|nr:hypothetical protein [Bacilli bacterium]
MKVLSTETTALLDKLYNLRSEDSYILVEMEKEKEIAEQTKEKTTKEKQELQDKISSLTEEESVLAEQGSHLSDVLSGINPDDFKMVLERLNIDFNPSAIKSKVEELLPGTIEEVVKETKKAEEELVKVEEEMNSAITKIDELAVRKDAELANQEKLNEYFDLALSGNINITREAITSLVSQFNFNEEEQREVAKLMMFPEDALYDYDRKQKEANSNSRSISDVLIEAKESVTRPIGEIFTNDNEEKTVELEEYNEPVEEDNNSESISDILKNEDLDKPFTFENVQTEELPSFDIKEEVKEEEEQPLQTEESMMDLFKRLGLSEIMFVESELSSLIELEDKQIVENNVNILNKYGINLDIVSDNVNILSDKELDEKIETIIEAGKSADDIYFNPSVLKKYDLAGLRNAIELLKQNGLDPKKVPLMAY